MSLEFPERLFHTLNDLERRWSADRSDIRQWLIGSQLTAAVWLPVMTVIDASSTPAFEHWEGYIRFSGPQCRRLFRNGWIPLREFIPFEGERNFRLPEVKDDVIVDLDELVVLETERRRFERLFPGITRLRKKVAPETAAAGGQVDFDPGYRSVRIAGRTHRFGPIQAGVIALLAEATARGEPWQSGKALLRDAGSECFSMSNLFKRHPAWREVIESDRRGFYRLSPAVPVAPSSLADRA
ncbi:hypothetical protein HAHE_25090 [Haloferula helveola]|uniref:Uncharacterized protein n=1 Tax=Haloferula helveola TaxID=490095 RepID=A0ABM7RAW0_9BACT|nr:hypothetical protein HAHE_25090 [Haloferula helveola]